MLLPGADEELEVSEVLRIGLNGIRLIDLIEGEDALSEEGPRIGLIAPVVCEKRTCGLRLRLRAQGELSTVFGF